MTPSAIVDTLVRVYGDHTGLRKIQGPYQYERFGPAEAALHELCHQVFLNMRCSVGDMGWTFDHIVKQLDAMPAWKADLHEIRTFAAEMIVVRRLRLPIRLRRLLPSVNRNMQTTKTTDDVRSLYKLARRTRKVQFAAEQVLALIERELNG